MNEKNKIKEYPELDFSLSLTFSDNEGEWMQYDYEMNEFSPSNHRYSVKQAISELAHSTSSLQVPKTSQVSKSRTQLADKGWKIGYNENGRRYYYNKKQGILTWNLPPELAQYNVAPKDLKTFRQRATASGFHCMFCGEMIELKQLLQHTPNCPEFQHFQLHFDDDDRQVLRDYMQLLLPSERKGTTSNPLHRINHDSKYRKHLEQISRFPPSTDKSTVIQPSESPKKANQATQPNSMSIRVPSDSPAKLDQTELPKKTFSPATFASPDRKAKSAASDAKENDSTSKCICRHCGRKFGVGRKEKHEKVCRTVFLGETPGFSWKANSTGKDRLHLRQSTPIAAKKERASLTGQSLADRFALHQQNLVACEFCARKFAPSGVAAHMKICQSVENRPKRRTAPISSSGVALNLARAG